MVRPEDTAARLQRRAAARREAGRRRADALRARLPAAVERLRLAGARRVVLFGSLAEDRPTPTSDVDLAVEGLPPADYFPVLADLMALFDAPVDLVRLEEAPESLRARIQAEGQPQ